MMNRQVKSGLGQRHRKKLSIFNYLNVFGRLEYRLVHQIFILGRGVRLPYRLPNPLFVKLQIGLDPIML